MSETSASPSEIQGFMKMKKDFFSPSEDVNIYTTETFSIRLKHEGTEEFLTGKPDFH